MFFLTINLELRDKGRFFSRDSEKSEQLINFLQKKCDAYTLNNNGGRIAAPRKGKSEGEESPGFKGTGYQITSGWRNPSESAAENIPPAGQACR